MTRTTSSIKNIKVRPLDSLRTLSWFVSYRCLSSQFQFSLSADTLEYLSQWSAPCDLFRSIMGVTFSNWSYTVEHRTGRAICPNHRVYRLPSFMSSSSELGPPPLTRKRVLPSLWVHGGEGFEGGPNSDEGTDTLVFYVNTIIILIPLRSKRSIYAINPIFSFTTSIAAKSLCIQLFSRCGFCN
jgi:hypothetical protein